MMRLESPRRLVPAAVGGFGLMTITAVFFLSPSDGVRLTQALIAIVFALLLLFSGVARPGALIAISPLLIWVYYSDGSRGVRLFTAVVVLAFLGAVLTKGPKPWPWAFIPLGLSVYLVLRELADLSGSVGPSSTVAVTVTALVAAAVATIVPPPRALFLGSVSLAGAVYALYGTSIGGLASRGDPILGTTANGVGLMASAGLVASSTLAIYSRQRLSKLLAAALALANLVGLITSNSQGGAIALTGALITLAWHWHRRALPLYAAGAIAIAYLVTRSGYSAILGGIQRDDASLAVSLAKRISLFEETSRLIQGAPLLGVGRAGGIELGEGYLVATHNLYTGMLLLGGAVGFTLFFFGALSIFIKRGAHEDRRLFLPLIVLFALLGLTMNWDWFPFAVIPMISIGILASSPRTKDRIANRGRSGGDGDSRITQQSRNTCSPVSRGQGATRRYPDSA